MQRIPDSIKQERRWVLWKSSDKIPLQTNGRRAASTNPKTWSTFDKAVAAMPKINADGVGFVLGGGYAGVDLDHVIDIRTGETAPWAEEVVRTLDSYAEVSQSGTGIHVLVRADSIPGNRHVVCVVPSESSEFGMGDDEEMEVYTDKRYFALTGARYGGHSDEVEYRQDELREVYLRHFPDPAQEQESKREVREPSEDEVVIESIREQVAQKALGAKNGNKTRDLYRGNWEKYGYKSQSEADAALCMALAFWTDDPAVVDSIFRDSKLMRDKWDERRFSNGLTYGQMTVRQAMSLTSGRYKDADRIRTTSLEKSLLAACYARPKRIPTVYSIVEDVQWPSLAGEKLWWTMVRSYDRLGLDLAAVKRDKETFDIVMRGLDMEEYKQVHDDRVVSWAEQMREGADKRNVLEELGRIEKDFREKGTELTPHEMVGQIVERCTRSVQRGTTSMGQLSMHTPSAIERLNRWMRGQKDEYLSTGIYSLDGLIEGLRVGRMLTFAAHTGAGKTVFLLNLADNIARRYVDSDESGSVLIFSAEMDEDEVYDRLASARSGVDLRKMRAGGASAREYERYRKAILELEKTPIYVDTHPAPTVEHMRARAMQINSVERLRMVGLDYAEIAGGSAGSEELRVSSVARGLNSIAKELRTAAVLLSQFNRNSLQGGAPRMPRVSDIRYSGKIEHESYQIILLHAPYALSSMGFENEEIPHYDPEDPYACMFSVSKNRGGRKGEEIYMQFQPEFVRFVDPNTPVE